MFDQIAKASRRSRAEVIETWKERAAIREYVGGLPRVEAELRAFDDTRAMFDASTKGISIKGARYVPDGDGYW